MKAPAFQWYPKDCDTDENVRLMNDEEFGFYVRCLNHAWLNDGLPSDPKDLRRLFGGRGSDDEETTDKRRTNDDETTDKRRTNDDETTDKRRTNDGQTTRKRRDRFTKIWKVVSRQFVMDDTTGRLVNLKQESQRVKQKAFSESRKKAAETKWAARTAEAECIPDARASVMQCSAFASASASASASAQQHTATPAEPPAEPPVELSPGRPPDAIRRPGPDFAAGRWAERLYRLHVKRRDRPLVEGVVLRIAERCRSSGADPERVFSEIEACLVAWNATAEWRQENGRYAPKLAQWLEDGGFEQWPQVVESATETRRKTARDLAWEEA